jgi:translation initiation factor 5B
MGKKGKNREDDFLAQMLADADGTGVGGNAVTAPADVDADDDTSKVSKTKKQARKQSQKADDEDDRVHASQTKPKGKKAEEVQDFEGDDDDSAPMKSAASVPAAASAGKRPTANSVFALLNQQSSDEDASQSDAEEDTSSKVQQSSKKAPAKPQEKPAEKMKKEAPPAKQAQAKGKGKKKDDFDELDAILAVQGKVSAAAPQPAAAKPASAKEDSPKVPHGNAGVSEESQSLHASQTVNAADSASGVAPESASEDDDDDDKADDKKKKRKKRKDKKEKEEEKPKKPSAAALKLIEAKKRQQEEIDRIRREEEERIRREEEAERLRKEEEERKEAEKKRKAEEKAQKRDQLRKEGKLLSQAEKKKRAMDLMRLEQMKQMGILPPHLAAAGSSAEGEASVHEETHEKDRDHAPSKAKKKDKKEDVIAKLEAEQRERDRLMALDRERRDAMRAEEQARREQAELDRIVAERLSLMSVQNKSSSVPRLQGSDDEGSDVDATLDDWEKLAEDSGDDDMSEVQEKSKPVSKQASAPVDEKVVKPVSQRKVEENTLLGNRSPIGVIMGHVDVGKTKLLDKIRGTNVQDNEAGGITQQIGATYFPFDSLMNRISVIRESSKLLKTVPGLLMIDTPGHESFTNLRSRGSSLCDIAVLVVDLMHGMEPQTRESLEMLRSRKTPFLVALNKVDRLYDWHPIKDNGIRESFEKNPQCLPEFNKRLAEIQLQFNELGINTTLYWDNKNFLKTVSLVPTSAHSGEGIPDLLMLLLQLTQKHMAERLKVDRKILEATVLEVKVVEGLGTTIDVILVNGELHEGDRIVICGLSGPIVTTIRALLTPKPMREIRVKGEYLHLKTVTAAQGIKISAPDLDNAIAGSPLYRVTNAQEEEDAKDMVMQDLAQLLASLDKTGKGVYVQASTLGSLEALLSFLKSSKIPVSGIGLGPVHKKDIMKASVMLEHAKEFACILAFDVKVSPEAAEIAESMGVRIFCADIIYHLQDMFNRYIEQVREEQKRALADKVIFPARFRIMKDHVFNSCDPIVVGIEVLEGILKPGSPLVCVLDNQKIDVGRLASIEKEGKSVSEARKGDNVAVKISARNPANSTIVIEKKKSPLIMQDIFTHINRDAIDTLKAFHKDELSNDDWKLVIKMKKVLGVE